MAIFKIAPTGELKHVSQPVLSICFVSQDVRQLNEVYKTETIYKKTDSLLKILPHQEIP